MFTMGSFFNDLFIFSGNNYTLYGKNRIAIITQQASFKFSRPKFLGVHCLRVTKHGYL